MFDRIRFHCSDIQVLLGRFKVDIDLSIKVDNNDKRQTIYKIH